MVHMRWLAAEDHKWLTNITCLAPEMCIPLQRWPTNPACKTFLQVSSWAKCPPQTSLWHEWRISWMSSLEGTFQSTWSFRMKKRSSPMSWYLIAFLASHLLSPLLECGRGSLVSRKHNTSWRDSLPYIFGSWSLTTPTVTSCKHSLWLGHQLPDF